MRVAPGAGVPTLKARRRQRGLGLLEVLLFIAIIGGILLAMHRSEEGRIDHAHLIRPNLLHLERPTQRRQRRRLGFFRRAGASRQHPEAGNGQPTGPGG